MKYLPSRKQWENWTLPSKASYISIILTIILFAVGLIINHHVNEYLETSDQPKLSIRPANKPYLRYEVIDNRIELSYELSISNLGKNTAIDVIYSHIKQQIVVADKVVVTKDMPPKSAPQKIISGDRYFQIFQLNRIDVNDSVINTIINDYEKGRLSVVIDIGIKYTDAITHKEYDTTERLQIFKNKDAILNDGAILEN